MPRVRAEINARLGEVGPSNVASLSQTDAATARMNRKYIALIEPLVDKFKATLLHEQKNLITGKIMNLRAVFAKTKRRY